MKYEIICPCPEVAITSWQRFVSIRPETVLTRDMKTGSAVESWFQWAQDVLGNANAHGKVLLKLLNTRAQIPAKTPAGSPSTPLPSSLCLFKAFVCIKLPETHSLGSLGGIQRARRHPIWARDPTISGTVGVYVLWVFLPSRCSRPCLLTHPQPSWWHWPGEMLLLLFNPSRSLTFS